MAGWLGWDWGNVPAWTGSILTSGSLLVAASAYRRSVRDRDGEQAAKVYCTITDEDTQPGGERVVRAINTSDVSVYAITIVLPIQDADSVQGRQKFTSSELSPDSELEICRAPISIAAPSEIRVSVRPVTGLRTSMSVGLSPQDLFPEIKFRDAAGRWWRRDGRGELRRSRAREIVRTSLSIQFFSRWSWVLEYDPRTRAWEINLGRRFRIAHKSPSGSSNPASPDSDS
jgi:hypothetical protein